ncbi:hypothetical protein AKJ59_00660 [candidate division MSBL1 archaeon SCGC-AAA385M02]|uniref:Uncharacterized protein n=1 Tax=candidate division MSBL1 archaeon SCGC-AAA385M02 TaxID=1698287 RepID=A0A133VQH6_9EURY|nr:hypothetical protein AKJ59_00660 [candidate division MSBL1 archaeon SCGC-AAA385M02]
MSRIIYVRCPYCGFSKVLYSDKYDGGVLRWGELAEDPTDYPLVEIREALPGPGRGRKVKGGGFQIVGKMPITEMLEKEEYRDIAMQMKDRFLSIIKAYIREGIISRDEI